jgi:hypothetical protein
MTDVGGNNVINHSELRAQVPMIVRIIRRHGCRPYYTATLQHSTWTPLQSQFRLTHSSIDWSWTINRVPRHPIYHDSQSLPMASLHSTILTRIHLIRASAMQVQVKRGSILRLYSRMKTVRRGESWNSLKAKVISKPYYRYPSYPAPISF